MDLWTLPIPNSVCTAPELSVLPRPGPCMDCAPHHAPDAVPDNDTTGLPHINVATFTHSVRTRANAVKFAHQSLCNPKISTLLKAVRKGFLKGCPYMTETLILKYPWRCSRCGHVHSTIWTRLPKTGGFILKCAGQCGACHRWASLQTNASAENWPHSAITNV